MTRIYTTRNHWISLKVMVHIQQRHPHTQTDGVAMGGPASSVVAEIYMQAHEQTALTTFSNKPKVWKRYVDDVFSIIKRCHLDEFFEHINSMHEQIKFTVEKENNSCLPFLDTCVKLSVSVFKKPKINFYFKHNSPLKNQPLLEMNPSLNWPQWESY